MYNEGTAYSKFDIAHYDKLSGHKDLLKDTFSNIQIQQSKNNFWEEELREKNSKIRELTDEVHSLRGNIEILKNSLANMDSYKIHIENLKKQKGIVEDKLKIFEEESLNKASQFTDQLKSFFEAENYLKSQMSNKDKIIMNLEQSIREKENHNKKLHDFLKNKENTFEELNNNTRNNLLKLEKKDEEIKKLTNELEQNENGRKKVEEKMKELIGIIKQQAKELADYEQQSQLLDKDRKGLIKMESQHLLEIENWKKKFIDVKDKMKESNEFRLKIQENESVIKEMNGIIEVERSKNNKLLNLNKVID